MTCWTLARRLGAGVGLEAAVVDVVREGRVADWSVLGVETTKEPGWLEVGVERAVEDTVVPGEGKGPSEPVIVWTCDKTYSMRSFLSPLLVSRRLSSLRPSKDSRREELKSSGQST